MTDKARELLERALEAFSSSLYGEFELKDEIRAYLAQPEVKPLTEDETAESTEVPYREWDGFVAGVRFAEKHHGIGGGNE